jgi:membrane protease YdiL (CAAX protease family)
MEAKQISLKPFFLCIAAVLIIEGGLWLAASSDISQPMMILGGGRTAEIIVMLGIVIFYGKGLSSIGLAPNKILSGLKKGVVWSAGFGVAAFIAFVVLYAVGMDPISLIKTSMPLKRDEVLIFFLVGGVIGPLAEEVFFRGVIYGFFRKWGVALGLGLSTLIFVLIHPLNQGFPVTQLVGGILFAVAYEIEGSLLTPFTLHALGNTAIFAISLLI